MVNMNGLLSYTQNGIYCAQADVYIDPWKPVNKAIITHAHADHSRWGMKHYLAHEDSAAVMKHRLGNDISLETKKYNEPFSINGVKFSLHPAGHIIGSAQIRVEYNHEIWVVSGDYNTQPDAYCPAFEPVKCHCFITESTFGLPVYKWEPTSVIFNQIHQWWQKNREEKKVSVLLAYSLGKAQRLIHHLHQEYGKIYTHGAIENTNEVLRKSGIRVPTTHRITQSTTTKEMLGQLVIAPPSAQNSTWMNKLKPHNIAMASGWMNLRGAKRRRNTERGFTLSDHADWNGLNQAVNASEAENIYVTHGYKTTFAQWLCEQGKNAMVLETEFEGELSELNESSTSA